MNIKFVTHLGDIVEDYNNDSQWELAKKSMEILDKANIPYAISPGNHDIEFNWTDGRNSNYLNKYFKIQDYNKKDWWGGSYDNTIDNTYQTFSIEDKDFLIFHLEYCPRDEILEWADNILKENINKRVIIVTHMYMNYDNTRIDGGDPLVKPTCRNHGELIWRELIRNNKNIFLVLSGHVDKPLGTAYLKTLGEEGNEVHQILSNYQAYENGGNGWLRIMTFYPEDNKVEVKTYSPYLDIYHASPDNNFEFFYNMQKNN